MLIPAFNAQDDLPRTLASLESDTVPFDIVVVDDGSEPPLQAPDAAGPHRIVLIRLPQNRGVAQALNVGASWVLEHGFDYLARLDAGDINAPGRLSRQLAFLEERPEIAVVGAWTRHLDERLRPLYVTRYPESWEGILRCFHYRTAFSHVACTIRASVLRRTGIYDERCRLAEDYDLFWRVATRFPCANIPEVLVTRVESSGSLTHRNRFAMARARLVLQWRHFAWSRLDCWLGVGRSLVLLLVPPALALTLKRAAGTVG